MACKKKMIEDGATTVPRQCADCGLGICPNYSYVPALTPGQRIQALETRVGELSAAMEEFCQRVERGEVRSTRTYEQFRKLLKEGQQ